MTVIDKIAAASISTIVVIFALYLYTLVQYQYNSKTVVDMVNLECIPTTMYVSILTQSKGWHSVQVMDCSNIKETE